MYLRGIILALIFSVTLSASFAQTDCHIEVIVSNAVYNRVYLTANEQEIIFEAKFAASERWELYRLNLQTLEQEQLNDFDNRDTNLYPDSYEFSPDGQYLVFFSRGQGERREQLYSVSIHGGNPIRLNFDLTTEGIEIDREPLREHHQSLIDFVITPDSQYVLYTVNYELDGVQRIYKVPINGGETVNLSPDFAIPDYGAVFLPQTTFFTDDGQYLIFLYYNNTQIPSLYALNLSDWIVAPIPNVQFGPATIAVAFKDLQHPDYDLIYVNSRGGLSYQQMFAYDFETGDHTLLTQLLPDGLYSINGVIFDEVQDPASIAYYYLQNTEGERELYRSVPSSGLEFVRPLSILELSIPPAQISAGYLFDLTSADPQGNLYFIPFSSPETTFEYEMRGFRLSNSSEWYFVDNYMLATAINSNSSLLSKELIVIDLSETGSRVAQRLTPPLSSDGVGLTGRILFSENRAYFVFNHQVYESTFPFETARPVSEVGIEIESLQTVFSDGRLLSLLENSENGTQDIAIINCP